MFSKVDTGGFSGRPGGFQLTDRAVELGGFKSGARILDIGCGSGATVMYLREKYGIDAEGLDKCILQPKKGNKLVHGYAEKLPFPEASADGVLMECSFSLTDEPEKVLGECYRVLKPTGWLIISDMYARGKAVRLASYLGRLETRDSLQNLLEDYRFKVELFEDHTFLLKSMWGQMILDQGAESFYCALGLDAASLKEARCGYYLLATVKIS